MTLVEWLILLSILAFFILVALAERRIGEDREKWYNDVRDGHHDPDTTVEKG
jgi:uncharacterized MAPEG superfamily protein